MSILRFILGCISRIPSSISPYSVRMQENADQNNSEYGNFSRSYPFIQVSLEWRFSELFSANVSLWSQYKYIAFNIFSCTVVIVLYEMLIITGISNEKTIYSIYEILCRSVTIFYQQELASLFQMQEKLKTCRSLVWTRVVWTFRVAIYCRWWPWLRKHDILHYWDNVHCLNIIQWKYL